MILGARTSRPHRTGGAKVVSVDHFRVNVQIRASRSKRTRRPRSQGPAFSQAKEYEDAGGQRDHGHNGDHDYYQGDDRQQLSVTAGRSRCYIDKESSR